LAGIVEEGAALETLPREARAFDRLELPKSIASKGSLRLDKVTHTSPLLAQLDCALRRGMDNSKAGAVFSFKKRESIKSYHGFSRKKINGARN
jgi:hypothetical protein